MRRLACLLCWFMAAGVPAPAHAAEQPVVASSPRLLSVTVYRAPTRQQGRMVLDRLGGFAFVSELREVAIPAGESTIRFEGVADGIDASSAIVTGLPGTVSEKNRDAAVLSPSALVAAAVADMVTLVRTDRATGRPTLVTGTVRSAADGGVVFESAQGIEALRCSGLPETLRFEPATTLNSTPTLSVRVQTPEAMTVAVTLSYLARGFDWAASYVATLAPDGRSMDLGAWLTLANGYGVGFPDAQTQVVAGRLNRERDIVEPLDLGGPILATCWPRGSTSDPPTHAGNSDSGAVGYLQKGEFRDVVVAAQRMQALAAPAPAAAMATAQQEDLGDLKLYRIPERTPIASRQSKQVRLLDRARIPIEVVYGYDAWPNVTLGATPAHRLLRTRNDSAHHLGLALPSGMVDSFVSEGSVDVLIGEAGMRDVAVDEELEIGAGDSMDVEVTSTLERVDKSADTRVSTAGRGGPTLSADISVANRVDVANARGAGITFEYRLGLAPGDALVGADHPYTMRNGRAVFSIPVPAGHTATLRFQTQRTRYITLPR